MALMASPAEVEPVEFSEAFGKTMELEGGGTLHKTPGDRGGWTKWGVSEAAHPELDIPSLTREDAEAIAREDYYEAVGGDALPPELRWHVFDMAYNAGVVQAAKQLQAAYNLYVMVQGWEPFLIVDGQVGPKTLAAVRAVPHPDRLVRLFQHKRRTHYVRLAVRNPQFLHGWLKRVDAVSA